MRPLVTEQIITIIQDDVVLVCMRLQMSCDFLSLGCCPFNINSRGQNHGHTNNLVNERKWI
nr:MAG TPA: hypothetical protein [Caudoviricetes sp.]